jgi:predicted CopG family antitoxin
MRTTIEITDEQRAKLLEAAGRRGEKGFSSIVKEALDQYFAGEAARRELIDRATEVIGSLTDEEADRLGSDTRRLRQTWR